MRIPDGLSAQEQAWFLEGADREIVQTILTRLAHERGNALAYRQRRDDYAKVIHDTIGAAQSLFVVVDTKRRVELRPEWVDNFVNRFRAVLKEAKW